MNDSPGVRPEDVLPDEANTVTIDDLTVRKGSVAAFVANVKLLETLPPDSPDRPAIEARMRALTPALRAVGVLDVFAPRSASVAAILGEAG
ncbi:hypothetical protein [Pseudonocardia acaciae]|uniref:hypothetical protein n=1 Tax=Pseudonocardia acaciae TaxID=551276 RepID=UPI00048C8D14|nr:hypothetical protein [Pseudonocardia acaciae]